jgi:hypothetical protein
MPGRFANIERLIDAVASDEVLPDPGIDRTTLLVELEIVKRIVANPRLAGVDIDLSGGDDLGFTGPEVDTGRCALCKRPY